MEQAEPQSYCFRDDDAIAIGQEPSSYVLDRNALTELPKKE
jgi:hypothetical protein